MGQMSKRVPRLLLKPMSQKFCGFCLVPTKDLYQMPGINKDASQDDLTNALQKKHRSLLPHLKSRRTGDYVKGKATEANIKHRIFLCKGSWLTASSPIGFSLMNARIQGFATLNRVHRSGFSNIPGKENYISNGGEGNHGSIEFSANSREITNWTAEPRNDNDSFCDHKEDFNQSCPNASDVYVPRFTEADVEMLPTVVLVGRPNVGKSALFNRLIRRREALVLNTPEGHMTRDLRQGVAKIGDLRFKVLDSAGLEAESISGTVLERTARLTANVLGRSHLAIFIIDGRCGLHPLDMEVAKWLRKRVPDVPVVIAMNKAEGIHDDSRGSLISCLGEAYSLGFGDPVPISAETGEGLNELYEMLHPHLEDALIRIITERDKCIEGGEEKIPLQLAIAGRPNVGKSTLLNTILREERVLTGPEPGLTRDSVRAEFEYDGWKVYLVDTAGWLKRTQIEGRSVSLSAMQTRKSIMRAHIVAIVLDGEEIAKTQRTMNHAEAALARMVLEEGRGLIVIVNKMDLLKGKANSQIREAMMIGVPEELEMVLPQVTGIPIVFISALEGKGRSAVMRKIIETYEKWCLRLPTSKLNHWLRKVMARHSWNDHVHGPKVKYLTQIKARPPTFVAFVRGSAELSQTDLRFLTKGLKEDFNLGGIPLRVLQRTVQRKAKSSTKGSSRKKPSKSCKAVVSDKRAES